MKKFFSIALVLMMIASLIITASAAATDPKKLEINMTTDLTVLPGAEAGDDEKVTILDKNSAYSTLADGKITMEYNGEGSTEQYARSMIRFNKQIAAATYKFLVIDIKFGAATLNHYKNGPTTDFTPHISVGYVNSDITANPIKWVDISAANGAILTTSETPDAFMNDTFVVDNVKDKTIQLLITLPAAEAVGYDTYLNMLYINPYGWASGATNKVKVEISGISFYDVNPFLKNEEKPTDEKPTDEKPTGEKPTSEKPTSEKPTSEKPTSEKPSATEPTKSNEAGCSSSIGGSAFVIAAALGSALTIIKKKKKF